VPDPCVLFALQRLRHAAFAGEREAEDVPSRLPCLDPSRRAFHVPPRRLVPARSALKRNPPLFEVQQRVVAMEAAQELPHLLRRPVDQAYRWLCWCVDSWQR
jgi:hypothetical protein